MTDRTYFLLSPDAPGHRIVKERIDSYGAAVRAQSEVLKTLAAHFGWTLPPDATFVMDLDRGGFIQNVRITCGSEALEAILKESRVPMLHREKTRWVEEHVRVVAKGAGYREFKEFAKSLGKIEDVPRLGESIWYALDKAFERETSGCGALEMFNGPGIQRVADDALLFTLFSTWTTWPALLEAAGARKIKGSEALKLIEDAEEAVH